MTLLAPRGAITHLAHHGRADGIWEITWDMGAGKRKVTLQMATGPTLVYQMWEKLDGVIDEIKDDAEDVDRLVLIGQANIVADILALFMKPHFTDRDSVLRESQRRWQCRQNGEEVETAGVGSLRFTPPPGTTRPTRPDPGISERKGRKPPKPKGSIPADSVEGVRKALESGMDPIIIANLYKVTVEQVQALK